MFISNGMVYGRIPEINAKITNVKILNDQIMILTFNGGEQRLFDASILRGSAFEPLKDPNIFKNAVLDHGMVTWLDGEIDCAPEYMYQHSYEYAIST